VVDAEDILVTLAEKFIADVEATRPPFCVRPKGIVIHRALVTTTTTRQQSAPESAYRGSVLWALRAGAGSRTPARWRQSSCSFSASPGLRAVLRRHPTAPRG
jgi:hypothetical protein